MKMVHIKNLKQIGRWKNRFGRNMDEFWDEYEIKMGIEGTKMDSAARSTNINMSFGLKPLKKQLVDNFLL